jgi:DNA-binding response OmpR family regulator
MSTKKILLVENDDFYDAVIGTFVKLFLQFTFTRVRIPAQALEEFVRGRPDLVLLDLDDKEHDARDNIAQ